MEIDTNGKLTHLHTTTTMKYLLTVLVITLTLNACRNDQGKGIAISVDNNSEQPIYNLTITTSEHLYSLHYPVLTADQEIDAFLDMEKNRIDGHYEISFTRKNGKKELIKRGYYTNGGPLEAQLDIDMQSDTTIMSTTGIPY